MVLLNTTAAPANTTAVLASQAANTSLAPEKETIIPRQAETESLQTGTVAPSPRIEEKISKPRFSVAEPEEKPVLFREKKKSNSLLIFIGAAVLVFILFIIYLKACSRPPVINNTIDTQRTDTAHAKVTPAVIPADTANKNNPVTEKKADTAVKQTDNVSKPAHVTEKKKEKPAAETHKKEPEPTANSGTATKYMVLLSVENTCTLKVNSMPYGEIQNGKPLRIYLTPGKYVLQFTSSSNNASTYTANIEVKPENLGHADKFKIPIK